MLLENIRRELDRGTARGADPAPYAWVTAGASDPHRRQIAAHRLPDTGDGLAIELCAERLAQNATLVEDWPDTLRHFHEVLWREPDKRFADLDRLPARHKRLLAGYNATDAYLPPARNLPALLDPVLGAEADRIAVHTTKARLEYRGFKARAYRLARLLRAHGVERNERVAVILHRTIDMPAALYGIICAGAAYVPLEPDMPPERIRGILQDTGARIVVTDADTLYAKEVQFEDSGIRAIVCMDSWPRRQHQGLPVDDAGVLEMFPGVPPEPINEPDDICYVIYTSGSTGKPKGVMVSHRAIVNTLIGVNNVLGVGRDDRVLCFSSYGFDLPVWDIFGSFLALRRWSFPPSPRSRIPRPSCASCARRR
jgi:non-ribosomal peptide synthetase component F